MIRNSRWLVILIGLNFHVKTLRAQYIGAEEIDTSKVVAWNASTMADYTGVYHFGFSEAECDLRVIVADTMICVQLKSSYWGNDERWHMDYKNLTNVKIEGNKFYSDLTNGEFVMYGDQKALKVYKPWTGVTENDAYEVGFGDTDIAKFYYGKWPKASIKVFTEKDLMKYNKIDLKRMRNEVYARYGFIFKEGGEMDKYFRKQQWYIPDYKIVERFLTEIEKKNVELIRQVENK